MRRVLYALLILNGLFLPLTCVPVVFVLNMVNPMQFMFIVEFTVENRTENTVYVTPVGTVGPEGFRSPLPMAVWKAPWAPSSQLGRFPVGSGEKILLYYDYDDINFSELVVEAADGQLRQLVVNPNPTANQYTVPKETEYVIDDLGSLGPVAPRVQAAYVTAQQPIPWWPILAACLVPAFTFRILKRWHRRVKASQPATNGEHPPSH